MTEALAELGVEYHGISQTEQYTSGAYREQILHAMKHRGDIDAVLDRYRTKDRPAPRSRAAEAAEAGRRGRAGGRRGLRRRRRGRRQRAAAPATSRTSRTAAGCDKDLTTVTAYDDETTELTYTCAVRPRRDRPARASSTAASWSGRSTGRCAGRYEGVVFEPSGVDHSSPGSSFVVGGQIVARGLRRRAADRPDVRLRRHQRHGQDVLLARAACPPRPTR